jgi:hypothetical protein
MVKPFCIICSLITPSTRGIDLFNNQYLFHILATFFVTLLTE